MVDYVEDLVVEDDLSSDAFVDHIDLGSEVFGLKLPTKSRSVTKQKEAENLNYNYNHLPVQNAPNFNSLQSAETGEKRDSESWNFHSLENVDEEKEAKRRHWPSHRYTQRIMTPWPVTNQSAISHRESKAISR
jgi:hypothetical protein